MSLSQVLAPQLQQSLALLQAPTLELKALVEQELQQNIVLEEVPAAEVELNERIKEDGASDSAADAADLAEPPADVKFPPGKPPRTNALFRSRPRSEVGRRNDYRQHRRRRLPQGQRR